MCLLWTNVWLASCPFLRLNLKEGLCFLLACCSLRSLPLTCLFRTNAFSRCPLRSLIYFCLLRANGGTLLVRTFYNTCLLRTNATSRCPLRSLTYSCLLRANALATRCSSGLSNKRIIRCPLETFSCLGISSISPENSKWNVLSAFVILLQFMWPSETIFKHYFLHHMLEL